MVLETKIEYKPEISGFKDISPTSVLEMLRDVRSDLGTLDPLFITKSLKEIVETVEKGEYLVQKNDAINTIIDFSRAKAIINSYRTSSIKGCISCILKGNYVIDAMDADSVDYCSIIKKESYLEGPSTEQVRRVRKNDGSCKDWDPKFPLTIEELIKHET